MMISIFMFHVSHPPSDESSKNKYKLLLLTASNKNYIVLGSSQVGTQAITINNNTYGSSRDALLMTRRSCKISYMHHIHIWAILITHILQNQVMHRIAFCRIM